MIQRIRGRRLQAERKRLLQTNPLCPQCEREGKVRMGEQRDHIIALCNGGQDVPENTQWLCKEHHAIKTATDRGYQPRRRFNADGSIIGEDNGRGGRSKV